MSPKKKIQHSEEVPLKLTAAERKLILDELMCLDQDYEQIIRETPSGKPVMMYLDDLEDFGGYIASEANHCEDKKKQKKLDAVFERVQDVLDKYMDEEPPLTLKIRDARNPQRKTKVNPGILYQFKITLLGVKPLIWRRIQVQDCTLDKLHEHIQTAMGWTNSHLHQFVIKEKRYGDPGLMDDLDCIDSTATMMSEILPKTGKPFRFKYDYDFGDGWEHEVLYEGSPLSEKGKKYPLCLEGERACPPEDIGGVWGYADYLEALADSQHELHEEYMEWNGPFDPDKFDSKKATKEMKKGLPNWRDR
ncbi:plasmid pRiA4b ORF-3 family protein [Bremerella alba]|uniref:Plasmid pRiA4b Orf3-like domain-containing protein n=1 Tax=Bremerella alba TaxID=980252 RepID=A0A7V8V843_9BACT|nr:plasmid pRiA4b ORF-3 family protein [Bremerella alba]MBA2116727.1 hypothetical protein [Bremerella alba]